MSKEVNAAVGTQRQFAKQPEMPYALRLNDVNFSGGIHQKTDYDAQLLAKSLNVIPQALINLHASIEKGKQENATLINTDKILAGKTKDDLKTFDRMLALQNVEGHNMTHNKYAMAALEQGIGKMASNYAKEIWSGLPESEKPTSVAEAVQKYNEILQENYDQFGVGIQNRTAFDKGYYEGAMADTMKVANEADARIDDDKRQKMVMLASTEIQDLIYQGTTGEDFSNNIEMSLRKMQLGCRSLEDFVSKVKPLFAILGEKDRDGSRLSSIENMKVWGDTPLKDVIAFAPLKSKIAQNCNKEIARQWVEACKLPNGGFDWNKLTRLKQEMPKEMLKSNIPLINIPISDGDNPDLVNVSQALKDTIPIIGGMLFQAGISDPMITSGYRSVKHNKAIGGAENSYHTYGEALDIYVGDVGDQEALLSRFRPFFKEALYHDAGSGLHLHLAGYQGGLDQQQTEDNTDMSYASYLIGNRDTELDKAVLKEVNQYRQLYKEQYDAIKNQTAQQMFRATNAKDAYDIIDKAEGLTPFDKQKLKNSYDNVFHTRSLAKKGQLPAMLSQIAKYEDPMSATNIYADQEVMEEYNTRMQDPEDEIDEKDQKKYNKVARRINAYWNKLAVVNGHKNYYEMSSAKSVDVNKQDPDLPQVVNAPSKEELTTLKELERLGMQELNQTLDRTTTERHIREMAKSKGIDPEKAVDFVFGGDD